MKEIIFRTTKGIYHRTPLTAKSAQLIDEAKKLFDKLLILDCVAFYNLQPIEIVEAIYVEIELDLKDECITSFSSDELVTRGKVLSWYTDATNFRESVDII